MKVLAILGSPRKQGNSEILLDQVRQGASSVGASVEKIVLNDLNFVPCQECGGCSKTGQCVINDQMQIIYKKIDEAEAVILATPIFFGSLPAQVKSMIDRYQCRWMAKYVLGAKDEGTIKKGALILVSASNRESFFKNAESIVKNFFVVAGIGFNGYLYCPNVDEKGKILTHPDYLKQAFTLGKNLRNRDVKKR